MSALLSPEFAITGSRQGATAIIELHGELDLAATAHVFAEFDKRLAPDSAAVIVDLRQLLFMDVCGMRALIVLGTSCEEQGRRFVLVRGHPAVHRLLARCERTFELVDSVAQALELTGAGDRSLTATTTQGRARSAPDFADHRTGALVDDEAKRTMRSPQGASARRRTMRALAVPPR
jgi:anti-sigma B factor antagonist